MSPRSEPIRPVREVASRSEYFTAERAKNVAIDALVCVEAWGLYSAAAAGLTGPGGAVVAGFGMATCVVKGLVDTIMPTDATLSAGQHAAALMSPSGMASFGVATSAGLSLDDSLFAADLGASLGSVTTNAFSGKPLGVSGSADFLDFTDKLAQSPDHLKKDQGKPATGSRSTEGSADGPDSVYDKSGAIRTGPARSTDDPREIIDKPGAGESGQGSIIA